MDMKTVKTFKEYQEIVNFVRINKKPIKVKNNLSEKEMEKLRERLNVRNIDIVVFVDCDEIMYRKNNTPLVPIHLLGQVKA